MRQAADQFPGAALRSVAGQASANGVNQVQREVGEVSQGLMLDLAVFAIGAAEEVGAVDLPVDDPCRGGYVDRTISAWHARSIAAQQEKVKRNLK
jgi:hypothetical protein